MWSSAAVTHLLQGSTCCALRDGAHSPLTSDINKAFSSTQLPLTGYFLFFGPFSVNPRDGCV